jgi:isoleucyl-tRNA synthetase
MFKPVDSKTSFPEMEKRILQLWKDRDVFRKSIEGRPEDRLYIFYEGPPTANARPGVHHVLSRAFKDLFPRYKTMRGYRVPRKAGWDTHGLPVELEVERELGLKSKLEIEEFGVEEFNRRCRESVFRCVQEWEALTERIAFWLDMEHPYVTYENDYIESVWWIVKQLWDKGLLYLDYRSTPHCPRCGTSLSDGEVALGYQENTPDPSIYVKFRLADPSTGSGQAPSTSSPEAQEADPALRLADGVPTYILAWTTTPWTLPGNTALAVQRYADYALIEVERDGRRERLILVDAPELRFGVEEFLREDYQRVEEVSRFQGAALVGHRYEPLYDPPAWGVQAMWFDPQQDGRLVTVEKGQAVEAAYSVIAGEFVSLSDGTGVVHIAPAFGGEDFDVGKELGLLFLQPVDLRGRLPEGCPWPGQFVKDADEPIMDDLTQRGLLLRRDIIRHTYPFCWRCDAPLLYYAKPTWYIRTTAVKDSLVQANERINWYPEHVKRGRFGDWLNNNVDWALSRERYWGTPLPIWQCDACGAQTCVGSREELLTGAADPAAADALDDLHRPYIDRIELRCDCGAAMRRLPEVMDVWFDSGAMPYAQWHYPFENRDTFARGFPADYICEAVDQTRGWFYTLHAEAVLLHAAGAAPENLCFRNVICLGHILDDKGRKMSKSVGNVVEPMEVIDRHGADALRWYLFTATRPGEARRFSADLVGESLRRFLLTLWNTYSFFVTYANIDRFDPTKAEQGERSELDRWVLSELHALVRRVTDDLEEYDPTSAGRAIQAFVEDLSNWYVRRSRRRFWKPAGGGFASGESENDADKLAAHHTLYACLVTLCKLLAPFTPFIADEMYQNLVRSVDEEAPESVHLVSWPSSDIIQPSGIPSAETFGTASVIDESLMESMRLAMRYSSLIRSARSKAGIKVRQPVNVELKPAKGEKDRIEVVMPIIQAETNAASVSIVTTFGPNIIAAEEGERGGGVDPHLTPQLVEEGRKRELIRRIQNRRKAEGFTITDRIVTYYQGPPWLRALFQKHRDYVRQETLSEELIEGPPPEGAHAEEQKLDGEPITLAVLRR